MSVESLGHSSRADVSRRVIGYWLIAVALCTFLMVIIGGVTRLTESGLSITEWNPVMGAVPPLNDSAWQEAFSRYQQIPEYHEVHSGMTLDEFKGIYFWEYLHRLVGRLTGLIALLPPVVLLVMGRIRLSQAPSLLAVPVLVGLQGVLGWYMVKSGLSVRTSVSQYRLTAHLATALLLYSYCIWQAATVLSPPLLGQDRLNKPGLRHATSFILGAICLTILAGGFVAGTKAGKIYNTFPLMEGRLVPNDYFFNQPWWSNPFENLAAIQFDHRVLAISTFCGVVALWLFSWQRTVPASLRQWFSLMLAAASLQVVLGISTLLMVVPIDLAACHQAGAVVLLTTGLLTLHAVRRSAG